MLKFHRSHFCLSCQNDVHLKRISSDGCSRSSGLGPALRHRTQRHCAVAMRAGVVTGHDGVGDRESGCGNSSGPCRTRCCPWVGREVTRPKRAPYFGELTNAFSHPAVFRNGNGAFLPRATMPETTARRPVGRQRRIQNRRTLTTTNFGRTVNVQGRAGFYVRHGTGVRPFIEVAQKLNVATLYWLR